MAHRTVLAIGMCCCLLGCEEEGIHAYRAPKPPPAKVEAALPTDRPPVHWDVPAGWESVESDQPLRLATFKPASGTPEITLSAFPGDSGGLLANINRWRGQIGLDPITEADLPKTVESSESAGVKVAITDLVGKDNQHMLAAVITPGDGQTWFVKATGDPAAIAAVKPSFTAFARSFHVDAAAAATPTPPANAAVGDPAAMLPTPAPTGEVNTRLLAFKPPAHWKRDPNASAMVAAAYEGTNADGVARITATMLLNDGGGVLANINRWRDQLGLPPVQRLDEQPITDLGKGNLIVDLASADGARRMMSAIVAYEGQTWFFKMTGPPKAVEAERAAYESLVRTVGLGEPAP